jgi:teichuronic acid exporter
MIRSVATILKGSVLAHLIGFAILPLLSRSFTPEAFGHFQLYQSILVFLVVIAAGRYEIAVLRAKDDAELAAVVALCCSLIFATTAAVSVCLAAAQALGWPEFIDSMRFPWWFISLAMSAGGAMALLSYLSTRAHSYGLIANSKIMQGVVSGGSMASIAVTSPITSGLIVGDLIGRFATLAWLAPKQLHHLRAARAARWAEVRAVSVTFRDLSTISLPSALFGTAATSLTPLLIYSSFAPHTAGQLGLTERAIGFPIALIVAAISQVHMGNLGRDLRSGGNDSRRLFRRLVAALAAAALPFAVIGAVFAVPMFRLVFGSGWDQAAMFAQLMAPCYFFSLVVGGINMTLTVMGRQITQLAWDVSRLGAMAALWFSALAAGWRIEWIIAAHSAVLSLFSILMLTLCYRALPRVEATIDSKAGVKGSTHAA